MGHLTTDCSVPNRQLGRMGGEPGTRANLPDPAAGVSGRNSSILATSCQPRPDVLTKRVARGPSGSLARTPAIGTPILHEHVHLAEQLLLRRHGRSLAHSAPLRSGLS